MTHSDSRRLTTAWATLHKSGKTFAEINYNTMADAHISFTASFDNLIQRAEQSLTPIQRALLCSNYGDDDQFVHADGVKDSVLNALGVSQTDAVDAVAELVRKGLLKPIMPGTCDTDKPAEAVINGDVSARIVRGVVQDFDFMPTIVGRLVTNLLSDAVAMSVQTAADNAEYTFYRDGLKR